jgi:uncharacterized membrane protein YeiB
MVFATALAFGALVASLEALRGSPAGLSFHVSIRTLVAFLIGAGVAVACWKLMDSGNSSTQRAGRIIGVAVLVATGLAGLLYPLQFVARDKLPDILIGLAIAVFALSLVGALLWLVHRFLDADTSREEQKARKP